MKILETGLEPINQFKKNHRSAGYTLLEVMAVITLIGLVTLIVYPQFTISPEKNEIIYVGKLLAADINMVKEEAFSVKKEVSIYFTTKGYVFMIDEIELFRNFNQYQFAFDVPVPKETEPEPGAENPAATYEAIESGEPTPGPEGGSEENGKTKTTGDSETEPHQLRFTSKGKCNLYELSWQTVHFSGKLKVDQDGVLDWSYARK